MIAIALAVLTTTAFGGPARLVLDDFEEGATWEGTVANSEFVKQGEASAAWVNHPENPNLVVPADVVPKAWSEYARLTFWMYSAVANNAKLTLVLDSEDPEDAAGWDYYFHHFRVDWAGWKQFHLHLGGDIQPTRNPRGWDQIDSFRIHTGGWDHSAKADTALYIDDVALERDVVSFKSSNPVVEQTDETYSATWQLSVTNRGDEARAYRLKVDADGLDAFQATLASEQTEVLGAGETSEIELVLRMDRDRASNRKPLTREACVVELADPPDGATVPPITVNAMVPLPPAEYPCLLATSEELAAAKARAAAQPWAKKIYDKIIAAADAALDDPVEVPDKGGQWSHWYSCPTHGRHLKGEGPTRHVCPVDGEVFTGWPYDDVQITYTHSAYTSKMQDLGLAYAWTGEAKYADSAREILLQYADKYGGYEIHNTRGKVSNSGGRRFAQTLDEAVSIIRVAWAYDLIYNSLSDEDRARIEDDFLRPSCETIMRHNAGISNWQTWHNAGVGAVGFCLRDAQLAGWAIEGRSGFRFQMANSILSDGFWYEGAAAYHFYSVRALVYTSEMARNAGVNLYADDRYRSLFDAPLEYVTPDARFPAVNDSDKFQLANQEANYAVAGIRWDDPAYLTVAALGGRTSLEALLLGPDEFEERPLPELKSRDFGGLGAAILRKGSGPDAVYAHLDYGQHGGGHGHPDKLTLILYALGSEIAPDPGRLAYGVPLHGTWYRQTIAHNTIVVGQTSQKPTDGTLDLFEVGDGYQAMSGSTDGAYPGVALRRAVVLIGDHLVDVVTAESDDEHVYDWAWHNRGELDVRLPLEPLAEPIHDGSGYQHIASTRAATTSDAWSAEWSLGDDKRVRLTMAGAADTEVFAGHGPGQPPSEEIPLVIARRRATRAAFASVIELAPGAEPPQVTVSTGDDAVTVAVVCNGVRETVVVRRTGEETTIEVTR